jgi:hypothetical protein
VVPAPETDLEKNLKVKEPEKKQGKNQRFFEGFEIPGTGSFFFWKTFGLKYIYI